MDINLEKCCSLIDSISFNIPDQIYNDLDIIANNYVKIVQQNIQEIPLHMLHINNCKFTEKQKTKIIFFLKENGLPILFETILRSMSFNISDTLLIEGLLDFYLESI